MNILNSLNGYDIVCAVILIVFMLVGMGRGLLRAVLSFSSTLIALLLTYWIYPYVTQLFKSFGIDQSIKSHIVSAMNLQNIADQATLKVEADIINSLPQSDFIKQHLQAGNNAEAQSALNVSGLADYIGGFLSNMAVNLMAILLVYLVVRIGLSIASGVLEAAAQLPVIHAVNALGGLLLGLVEGLVTVWIVLCVLNFVCLNNTEMFSQIESGKLVGYLYNNNPIMYWLVKIIPG
jgi:uncharacterized membrane protein required for colicin V production